MMEKYINDKGTEMSIYTEQELMARLKFFIGICLALTLVGIVFVVLYSLIFVTQPMNAISPMDQKFFELIIPIATFLTGTLSGIMLAGDDKDLRAKAIDAANKPPTISPAPTGGGSSSSFGGNAGSFKAPSPVPSFGASTSESSFAAAPLTSSTGKPMPAQPDHPEI